METIILVTISDDPQVKELGEQLGEIVITFEEYEKMLVGQAAAIANAMMNVAEVITKATAQGVLFGPAMGAAVAADEIKRVPKIVVKNPEALIRTAGSRQ